MYNKIKRVVKTIIPNSILFKFEPKFRYVFYQFYKGKNYQCNICNKSLRKFIRLENEDKLCPNCGSISRSRRLWDLVTSEFLKQGLTILDFSPSRSLYRILKSNPLINYMSTDLSSDFLSDFRFDITNIDSENEKYDLILCYHILEHIEDDYQAMRELYRVMKKGAICIIQTPFKEGNIYEHSSIKTEKDRLEHFGQKDHVRIYSLIGLKERLIKCGFNVTIKQFNDLADNKFGFKTREEVLICTK